MAKEFNIKDWQKKHLNEQVDEQSTFGEWEPTDADQEVIDGRIMGEIFDLIRHNGLEAENVMDDIATEFDIAFEFGRASGMAKQAGEEAGFDMRGIK